MARFVFCRVGLGPSAQSFGILFREPRYVSSWIFLGVVIFRKHRPSEQLPYYLHQIIGRLGKIGLLVAQLCNVSGFHISEWQVADAHASDRSFANRVEYPPAHL